MSLSTLSLSHHACVLNKVLYKGMPTSLLPNQKAAMTCVRATVPAVVPDNHSECTLCGVPIGLPDRHSIAEWPYETPCGHLFGDLCIAQTMIVNPSCPDCRGPLFRWACIDNGKVNWKMLVEQNFILAYRLFLTKKVSFDEQWLKFQQINWIELIDACERTGDDNHQLDRLEDFEKVKQELLEASPHLIPYVPSGVQRYKIEEIYRTVVQIQNHFEVFSEWMHHRVQCLRNQLNTIDLFLDTIDLNLGDDETTFRNTAFNAYYELMTPFRFTFKDAEKMVRIHHEGEGEVVHDRLAPEVLKRFELEFEFISSRIEKLDAYEAEAGSLDLETKREQITELGYMTSEIVVKTFVLLLLKVWVDEYAQHDLFFLSEEQSNQLEDMLEEGYDACAGFMHMQNEFQRELHERGLPTEVFMHFG